MVEVLHIPGIQLYCELQDNSAGTGEAVFPLPERGFLAGTENAVLIPLVKKIIDGTLKRTQLPVFFYGASGSGKTHILQGIYTVHKNSLNSNKIKKTEKIPKPLYITATDFLRSFTEAIDTKTANDYRKRFRNTSLLLLDDIDHIIGKDWLLNELQFALDELTANGITAVFTAKQYPSVSAGYPEPLCTRLAAGTVIPVLPPGIEVRTQFLTEMSAAYYLPLPVSALEKAAHHLPVLIPKLYHTFSKMVFTAKSENKKVDTDYLLRFVSGEGIPHKDKKTEADTIIKKTAKHFSLKPFQIKGKSRCKTVALARSIAVYLIRRNTGMQYKDIACYFSSRDVSTLRHLTLKIENELKEDLQLRKYIAGIEQ